METWYYLTRGYNSLPFSPPKPECEIICPVPKQFGIETLKYDDATQTAIFLATYPWQVSTTLLQDLDYQAYNRVLVTSWVGLWQGKWCDGPIVEIRNGHIASYIATGGPAALLCPKSLDDVFTPVLKPLELEGEDLARMHRVYLGRFLLKGAQLKLPEKLSIKIRPTTESAIALLLIRQIFPEKIINAALDPLPKLREDMGAWRRFCQNTRISLTNELTKDALAADEFTAELESEDTESLLKALVMKTDVIPHRLRHLSHLSRG